MDVLFYYGLGVGIVGTVLVFRLLGDKIPTAIGGRSGGKALDPKQQK